MVESAIIQLKERNGSSLQAIKKFIATNFEVDMNYIYPRMKSYLKQAIEEGILINMTGIGALGSFKFSKERKDEMKKEEKAKMKKIVLNEKKEEKLPHKSKKVTEKKKPSKSKNKTKSTKKTMEEKRKTMPKVKAIKA